LNFLSLYKRKLLYKLRKKINIDEHDTFHNHNLEKIFSFYGTDKASSFNNGKNKGHGFSKFYEEQLLSLREKKINILEIGSYSGASAAAFSKYFPNSKIFCLDVNISNFKYCSNKIEVFGLDVSQKKMINKFFKEIKVERSDNIFDIIIDDGSHKLSDMLIAFKYFFNNLRKNGFYIIEDYKFPNYFKHLDDIQHDKLDVVMNNLKNKKIFNSKIFDESFQRKLHNSIKKISLHQGNSEYSNIAFIQKNVQF